MDVSAKNRAMMVRQTIGMIVCMVSVVVSTLKRVRDEPESEPDLEPNPLLYNLRSDAEHHRQRTLQGIYHSTDVECVSMLRMRRMPFFSLCNLFRTRGLLQDNAGVSIEEQAAIRGLGWCTNPLGGPLRQSTGTFTKFCMLLVSLEMT